LPRVFARLNPAEAAPEAIDGLLTLAGNIRDLGEAAKGLPGVMGSVANLSASARESLLGLAGGLDALLQKQGTYYSEFFTEQQKADNSARVLGQAFAALGIEGVSLAGVMGDADGPRQAFQDLVEGLRDGSGNIAESNLGLYNSLLDLAGPLAGYIDLVEGMADATVDAAQSTTGAVTQSAQAAAYFSDAIAEIGERISRHPIRNGRPGTRPRSSQSRRRNDRRAAHPHGGQRERTQGSARGDH
jgi:hypothetical protein